MGENSLTAAQGESIRAEYSASLEENLAKAKERLEASKTRSCAPDALGDAFKGSNAVFQRGATTTRRSRPA